METWKSMLGESIWFEIKTFSFEIMNYASNSRLFRSKSWTVLRIQDFFVRKHELSSGVKTFSYLECNLLGNCTPKGARPPGTPRGMGRMWGGAAPHGPTIIEGFKVANLGPWWPCHPKGPGPKSQSINQKVLRVSILLQLHEGLMQLLLLL